MDDTEEWLAQYKAKIAAREQEAAASRANIASVSATVCSEDESVTVTVGAHNVVHDLRFSTRAMAHDPTRLAALVLRTITAGQRAVTAKQIAAVEPTAAGGAVAAMLTETMGDTEVPGEKRPANAFDELVADPPEPAPQPPLHPSRPASLSGWAPTTVAHPVRRAGAGRAVPEDLDDFSEENPW
jgi:YbaB/EbfC DNA-binding family